MTVPDSETVIIITRNGMGDADQVLQHQLIAKYFQLIYENEVYPPVICFYTDGVKLAVSGSPVLDVLQSLEGKGVRLILCGTCLEHFGLKDQVQVGIIGGMTDIIEAQRRAGKVVSL
jgi:hypothetical protein